MTALAPVPQTVRVDVGGLILGGQAWDTRFFVKYAGTAPTVADLNAFCLAIATAWSTYLIDKTGTESTLTQVKATDLTSPSSPEGVHTGSVPGTRTGQGLPASVAMVVGYEIAVRYRGGHPRGYWRAGVGTDVNPVDWTPSFLTGWQTSIVAFFNAVKAAGWSGSSSLQHVAVSYYYTPNPKPPSPPFTVPRPVPVSYPVVGYVARSSLGTQRRRLHYNG